MMVRMRRVSVLVGEDILRGRWAEREVGRVEDLVGVGVGFEIGRRMGGAGGLCAPHCRAW